MMGNFESCTLLVVGRELVKTEQGGEAMYAASPEMVRRANEAGMSWHAYGPEKIDSVVCTGGFPGAALGMGKPPEGINEGTFLRDILVHVWDVPPEIIKIEGDSDNTFDNFWECIRRDFLRPGAFQPNHPLVLSTNTFHAWRLGILAASGLRIPDDALFRLRPGNIEGDFLRTKEHRLAKVTQLAIERTIAWGKIEPGEQDFIKDVQAEFRHLWLHGGPERRSLALADFNKTRGAAWLPPNIPILDYPVFEASQTTPFL
jgi:hypothetical protein